MKRFKTQAIAALIMPAVVAVGAASASSASATTGEADRTGPVITDVRTAAAFDYAAGQEPENVTINPDGSLTISMLGFLVGQPPELLRISPSGQQTVLVTGPAGDAIGGNARGRDGSIYYNVLSSDPSRSGVWRLPPGGASQRIAALPAGQFLNGLTIDSSGQTLYAADSKASTIWSVSTSGGPAKAWLVSPALAPSTAAGFGANGVTFHNGAVWASNTDQGTLLRVPVTAAGAPGPVKVIASNLAGIDDFKFLSDQSDVAFVALNAPDEIAVVYPGGRTKIVLTASDGLASPTDTAVHGTQIFITNAGIATPHDAKLLLGKINIETLLGGAAS